jgi:Paf1
VQKERAEKEKIRKEHARKVLEQQKIQTARRKWQKDSEFLCHLKFRNNLPDPPLGPHFLKIPLSLDKLVEYRPTSLETLHKWKLHCNRDLGVDIDIIDSRSYTVPEAPQPLHPKDQELLQWDKVRGEDQMHGQWTCWWWHRLALRDSVHVQLELADPEGLCAP